MASESQVTDAGAHVHLPPSLCEALVAAFPKTSSQTAPDFAAMISDLLACAPVRTSTPATASAKICRSRATPELHGGPEGAYQRDVSTGRWRSQDRSQPPQPRTKPCASPKLAPELASEAEELAPAPEAEDPQEPVRPQNAAEAALSRAKAETMKLWEAARKTLGDPRVRSFKQQDAMQRTMAEVELEKSMLAASWKLFRDSLDKKELGEITRMAAGCEGGRALSVGVARHLFENVGSSGRSSSRGGKPRAKPKRSSAALPPRPTTEHEGAERTQEKKPEKMSARPESPSVRHRIGAWEISQAAPFGGA
ncbi:hypothetical protein AK812_SmicGene25050 [Symbiodinium microadriaticum]|uniref:Uncharacterized protein n=1 Tax=Symbiodinium microadriaticum TaxID=2951 RepID=A0A1Q9DD04_SYMMI|nr:hypothetical protein AK812_SmicGene25050 [Symbiodinium microadriaticum]CAE7907200.1 unnamed protein product [Symbiodinium microadriaticum]CAE7941048.1 unnamed protein product [Symbiodinium sp. KB8]